MSAHRYGCGTREWGITHAGGFFPQPGWVAFAQHSLARLLFALELKLGKLGSWGTDDAAIDSSSDSSSESSSVNSGICGARGQTKHEEVKRYRERGQVSQRSQCKGQHAVLRALLCIAAHLGSPHHWHTVAVAVRPLARRLVVGRSLIAGRSTNDLLVAGRSTNDLLHAGLARLQSRTRPIDRGRQVWGSCAERPPLEALPSADQASRSK